MSNSTIHEIKPMYKSLFKPTFPIILSAMILPINGIAADKKTAIEFMNEKLQEINKLQKELTTQLDESRSRQIEMEQQRQLEIQNAQLSGQVEALQQQVKLNEQVQELQKQVKDLQQLVTPSKWYNLLDAPGWNHNVNSLYPAASCRVVNGWIEFRGLSFKSLAAGWPAESPLFLPVECRPQTARYINMPCHAEGGHPIKNGVCNNDFHPDGVVKIHSDFPTIQQRWDGVRIWAGEN